MKRRWPKLSLRLMLVFAGAFCAYLACWGPTQSRGLTDVENHVYWGGQSPRGRARVYGVNTTSSLPLVVGTDVHGLRAYYLWCFGMVLKLPFETRIPSDTDHWGYVMKVGKSTKLDVQARFGTPDLIVSDLEWAYREIGTFRFDEEGRITQLAD